MPLRLLALEPDIDHIISEQHGGETVLENLAMACAHCNAHKGPNVAGVDPKTRAIVPLFNPRADRWSKHFTWSGPLLLGITACGRATIRALFINDPLEVQARARLMDEGKF